MLARLIHPAPEALGAALVRYRVMAYVVGVGLATLVFVGMPLKYGLGFSAVVNVFGALHGFLYIVYLFAALDLARRARFSIGEMLAMVGAGLLPGLAFVIERRVTRRVKAKMVTTLAPSLGKN